MTDILREIMAHKQDEARRLDVEALRSAARSAPAPRDFLRALLRGRGDLPPRLIGELKLASPSKGLLAPNLDVLQMAEIYAANGAAAISVLTDAPYFHGNLETLRKLRFEKEIRLPLLRKDFIIAEAQVYESRASGADAILLIVAAFDDPVRLAGLHSAALDLGLTPLVEVHNQREVERALHLSDIRLIGINNRDLATFKISLETTERLRPLIPVGLPVLSESGIFTAYDVQRLAAAEVEAVLVGEALVTAPDAAAKVQELAGIQMKAHD